MGQMLRVPYKMLSTPMPVQSWNAGTTALLLMDFQKFTCSRTGGLGSLAKLKGITPELDEYYNQVEAALRNGNRLAQACRKHEIDVAFAYLHAGDGISRQFQVSLLPLPQGELEEEMVEEVHPLQNEQVFTRGVYSAFLGTGLEGWLQQRQKETLIIGGMLFNYSVALTAREAADRGYDVIVVWDASASESLDWHLVTRTGLVGGLILSRSSGEVIEMMEGRRQ